MRRSLSKKTVVIISAVFLLNGFLCGLASSAEEAGGNSVSAAASRNSRAAKSTAKQSTAESASDQARVEKRLKEILANQEKILANQATILQKFDAIMEELRIIKVRATLRAGS